MSRYQTLRPCDMDRRCYLNNLHLGGHKYPDEIDISLPPPESMEQEVIRLRSENDRLRDVLRTLAGEQFCVSTSGGTEGKWCCNHDDFPMVGETDCALMQRVWETLAQTGAP